MIAEIQALKESLGADSRGSAVKSIHQKLTALISSADWDATEEFFREFFETFGHGSSNLGIVKNEFRILVDAILVDLNFQNVLRLNRLQNLPWFDLLEDVHYKKGLIAESLAKYSQSTSGLIELQAARTYFRKAHRKEDVSRVQALISEKARSFNLWAPINPPASMIASIHEGAIGALQSWLSQEDDVRLSLLVDDYFGIRPSGPGSHREVGDVYLSGALHELGVIQSIEISLDGRISAGKGASPIERVEFGSWDYTHRIFLDVFLPEVKKWLSRKDGEVVVWQKIFVSLRRYLNWEDNSAEHFYEGFSGWMGGVPQIALSFWLPQFESILRNRLADLGEDVISPKDKTGLEDFITFDGLLSKAANHYDASSIRYWKRLFSKDNGLGMNLRHSFCHGLLPMRAMKVEIYSLAVFQAYLFLVIPPQEDSIPNEPGSKDQSDGVTP